MTKIKPYLVTRNMVVVDSCIVKAKNKTEAVKKAKSEEFINDNSGKSYDWEFDYILKINKSSYEAREQ